MDRFKFRVRYLSKNDQNIFFISLLLLKIIAAGPQLISDVGGVRIYLCEANPNVINKLTTIGITRQINGTRVFSTLAEASKNLLTEH